MHASTAHNRMAPTMILEPADGCLCDQPVLISVSGLAPEQPVTLRAALRDEKGASFRAHARYRADAHGRLDLARAPALGGSFAGLEPMGLLWALEPERPFWRLVKRDVRTPFVVELEVLDGHEPDGGRLLARAVHERHFMAPGVRRVPVREGRVRATLFLPPGHSLKKRKKRGSDVPCPSPAPCIDRRMRYQDIWKLICKVKGPGVGVLGISKGGELGLAMASFLKGIKAAVIINGSVAAVGNTIKYKDETIPPVSLLRNRVRMTKDGLQDVVEGLQSPLVEQKSFIPVERSDTTFLLIVGQDDHNWKSEFYANEISKRLQAHGKEKPQIICYPEAGHYIEPPYFPLCKAGMHLLVGANIVFGGEPKPHAMAQLDAWQQLQTFFHKHLGGEEGTMPAKL
ncbi:acyl-coenzyme A thioesterase 1-like isoform X2 [Peromyscus leucopus]|uniref:acyl-coenzyme A thioesterase 1-like isoform X2 n=1 Tax=Peromyscus leucopus TaxID=10041 RepID=UPI0018855D6E|nr:acyl-coenzyme A thioesterase 1-like isoform X2 [Peromyscus leucopus]